MNSKRNGNTDFDEFVKRQQTAVEEGLVDWSKERDDWLRHLTELYEQTESFLAEYLDAGQIKLNYAISS